MSRTLKSKQQHNIVFVISSFRWRWRLRPSARGSPGASYWCPIPLEQEHFNGLYTGDYIHN